MAAAVVKEIFEALPYLRTRGRKVVGMTITNFSKWVGKKKG
jgi:hypothetical protein